MFSREKITKIAYKIVKKDGLDSVTARNIGEKLGSSARPIFTVFQNMNEVKLEIRKIALKEFKGILLEGENDITLKDIAVKTVKYASSEPELFKTLFAGDDIEEKEVKKTVCNLIGIEELFTVAIKNEYLVTEIQAKEFFEQLWIHIFGMATLSAEGIFEFSLFDAENKILQAINGICNAMDISKADNLPQIEQEAGEPDEWVDAVFDTDTVSQKEPEIIEYKSNDNAVSNKKRTEKDRIFSWLD